MPQDWQSHNQFRSGSSVVSTPKAVWLDGLRFRNLCAWQHGSQEYKTHQISLWPLPSIVNSSPIPSYTFDSWSLLGTLYIATCNERTEHTRRHQSNRVILGPSSPPRKQCQNCSPVSPLCAQALWCALWQLVKISQVIYTDQPSHQSMISIAQVQRLWDVLRWTSCLYMHALVFPDVGDAGFSQFWVGTTFQHRV